MRLILLLALMPLFQFSEVAKAMGGKEYSKSTHHSHHSEEEQNTKNNTSPSVSNSQPSSGNPIIISDPNSPSHPNRNNTQPSHTNQSTAQDQTVYLNETSSGISASIGAIACAEAANTIHENTPASGALIGSCLENLDSANQMKDSQAIAAANADSSATKELKIDSDVLNSAKATDVFNDLNKKYGIDKEKFSQSLLATKGNIEVLGKQETLNDLFGGKISKDDVDKALEEANKLSDLEKKALLDESRIAGLANDFSYKLKTGAFAPARKVASTDFKESLREKLRNKVDSIANTQPEEAATAAEKPNEKSESLTPIEDPLFSMAEIRNSPSIGSSIFDVVHRRYIEKFEMMKASQSIKNIR